MDIRNVRERILHTEEPPQGHLNMLGYVVCPLKQIYREGMAEHWATRKSFICFAAVNCPISRNSEPMNLKRRDWVGLYCG